MNQTAESLLVDLSVEIEASPGTVWAILTTPDLFSAWMNGQVEFDASVGSRFTASFPQFETVVAGEIVTLDGDARHLGVTWGVESGAQAEGFPVGSSLVEFRVCESEDGCRVELRHSAFPTEALAREHGAGWRFHLSRMALQANRADLQAGLESTLRGWFRAWNEPDADARLEILRGCCAAGVEFRDDWAVARGVDLLSQHIGNCFTYMPGFELEPTGDVRICRGEALVGWRGVGAGGAAREGFNHVRADYDGTLRRVTGFTAG